MSADGTTEVRFDIPADDLSVLDAYCIASGKKRTAVMATLLLDWTKAKRHEAMMICRVAGINPNSPDGERK